MAVEKKIDIFKKYNSELLPREMWTKYDIKELLQEELYFKYAKCIDKVIKKIIKRVQENPFKTYIKISSSHFSKKEMRAIKLYFEKMNFEISFNKPVDDMIKIKHYFNIDHISVERGTSTTLGNVYVNNTTKTEKVFKEKFYICW